jgi:hypothetical protein
MTLLRKPGSAKAELQLAIEQLSPEEIRDATGVSVQAVTEGSHPNKRKQPSLEVAAAIDAALMAKGRLPLMLGFYEHHRNAVLSRLGGRPAHRPLSPAERLMQVTAEVGDVATVMARALTDGELNPTECAALIREVREAKERLEALERDIETGCKSPTLKFVRAG